MEQISQKPKKSILTLTILTGLSSLILAGLGIIFLPTIIEFISINKDNRINPAFLLYSIFGFPIFFISIFTFVLLLIWIASAKTEKNPDLSSIISKLCILASTIPLIAVLASLFDINYLVIGIFFPIAIFDLPFYKIIQYSKNENNSHNEANNAKLLPEKSYESSKSMLNSIAPQFKKVLIVFNIILLILFIKYFANEAVFGVVTLFVFSLPIQILMIIFYSRLKKSSNN